MNIEVFSYIKSRAIKAMGIDGCKETYETFLVPGHSIAAGVITAYCVGWGFVAPCHTGVVEDWVRGRKQFSAIKTFGSFVLDIGVDVGIAALLFGGNIDVGEAALFKLGYNSACVVGPDALRSVRSRLEVRRSPVNPAQ